MCGSLISFLLLITALNIAFFLASDLLLIDPELSLRIISHITPHPTPIPSSSVFKSSSLFYFVYIHGEISYSQLSIKGELLEQSILPKKYL